MSRPNEATTLVVARRQGEREEFTKLTQKQAIRTTKKAQTRARKNTLLSGLMKIIFAIY